MLSNINRTSFSHKLFPHASSAEGFPMRSRLEEVNMSNGGFCVSLGCGVHGTRLIVRATD